MIYVLIEDSTDGKILCDEIVNLYFEKYKQEICVKSYNGIQRLADELEMLLKKSDEDSILVVYDDIKENPIVAEALINAEKYIELQNVYMIPTNSFELEAIMIDGIEFTANVDNYNDYVKNIKDSYANNNDIRYLTKITKDDKRYDIMYAHIREEKAKRRMYQKLTPKQFEKAITIESLSKRLLSRMYADCIITKPMGECWINTCCYKVRHGKCSPYLDREKLLHSDYALLRVMIFNTSYRMLLVALSKLLAVEIKENSIKINELLNKETVDMYYIKSAVKEGKE